MPADEVDVRDVPKPQRHPMIFQRFSKLAVGEAFVLINGHDPRHLHDEFERDYPRRYSWNYVETGPTEWRIRIGKCAAAELPRVVCNAYTVDDHEATGDAAGALWKLEAQEHEISQELADLVLPLPEPPTDAPPASGAAAASPAVAKKA